MIRRKGWDQKRVEKLIAGGWYASWLMREVSEGKDFFQKIKEEVKEKDIWGRGEGVDKGVMEDIGLSM